ncbi:Chaperone protein DnaJ [Candidatus Magnetomorum sp. HK-1]|nr:Chaperone protein DnaJ [Candidatus Magnetomorum sp. HK-1]
MLNSYLVFDLPHDATEDDIRQAYLQKVKKYTPEKEPERFRQITEAYETIKNKRIRIHNQLHALINISDCEEKLFELSKVNPLKRRRMGLIDILDAQSKVKK